MQYVPSITSVKAGPVERQVTGLTRINAVKPIREGEPAVQNVENKVSRQEPLPVGAQYQRAEPFEDRRKVCRRVNHQTVLVELRSGIDRRRHNLRGSDIVEHIDETA
jgi:hypothetical protein